MEREPGRRQPGHLHAAVALLAGSLLLAAATGCGVGGSGAEGDAVEAAKGDTLTLRVSTDRPTYRPGEPVSVRLEVRNPGPDTARLTFPTSQRFDVVVEDTTGRVWSRWSRDRAFLQVLGNVVLPPDSVQVYEATLGDTLAVGRYQLIGVILGQDRRLADTAALRLTSEAPSERR